jgi:phage repressor protein C with HTH and peptisase S24 domain
MAMLTHAQVWGAIDGLAKRYGMTPSGLARKAGLDATTFNKSKRIANDGKTRWPSTESVSKVLQATGATLEAFVSLATGGSKQEPPSRTLPLLGIAQAGAGGFFDDAGLPRGEGWEEVAFPGITDTQSYALEVSGDSMLPLYRDGDIIIVSPAAQIRKGDRVVVRTKEGEVMVKELRRHTAKTVELRSINPDHSDRVIAVSDISVLARIIWSSQ